MFYAVYTITTLLGAGIVLLPRVPLLLAMLVSQDINGILLPVVLIFMLLLVNNKRIMGDYTNSAVYNVIAWGTVGALILLSLLLVGTSLLPGK